MNANMLLTRTKHFTFLSLSHLGAVQIVVVVPTSSYTSMRVSYIMIKVDSAVAVKV